MIISFYSYKGGVGRTQLLANLAGYLCFVKGKKILMMDWDFEAPGIDAYFREQIDRSTIKNGILEYFEHYTRLMQSTLDIQEQDLPRLSENDYITPITSTNRGGKIDMIACGNYSKDYSRRLIEFNWMYFYETLDGKNFIEEHLKKELNELDYDFVFVDSRTGVADYSGICNIQLPALNILMVVPNEQNFQGTLRVANSIKESAYVKAGLREPHILPILSRIDTDMNDKLKEWFAKFRMTFKDYLETFSLYTMEFETELVNQTLLPYKKDIAYGENLLFNDQFLPSLSNDSLEKRYANIANYILDNFFPKDLLLRQKYQTSDTDLQNDIQEKIEALDALYHTYLNTIGGDLARINDADYWFLVQQMNQPTAEVDRENHFRAQEDATVVRGWVETQKRQYRTDRDRLMLEFYNSQNVS